MTTLQIDDVVVKELNDWKNEFSNLQGNLERALLDLEKELKVIEVKRHCLFSVKERTEGYSGVQKDIARDLYKNMDDRRNSLLDEIEQKKADIAISIEMNKIIFEEVDKRIALGGK
ncbi:hypothetical protein ACFMB7_33375 (plasmid) [Bacillus toyonensis]